ncbi:MAG: Mrp/NBP35 family ATP-binding protein [Clostridia bacterium]|nr:Mrp/NBP35 family ATP-binding protein [Clostridia bacterium]
MSDCTHDCSTCESKCEKADFLQPLNVNSSVGKVIAVASGKGGVGKSLVTSMLACESAERGFNTAILDADVTGPSIPKAFGLHDQAVGTELGIEPAIAGNGIKVMSINLIIDDEEKPVVWRGPVISGVINQFWTDVNWGNVDYMFVDMPPGTGDVPLTVYQSLPVDGIVIVATPQDLVKLIVKKAYNMAKMMNVPVLGVVENMSYVECPDCGKKIEIFGKSKAEEIAAELGVPVLATLPVDPHTAELVDEGKAVGMDKPGIDTAFDKILEQL